MASSAHLDLYTAGTPNGQKASIILEELGLPYTVHKIDLGRNEQKEDWYLKINPNGRIPSLLVQDPSAFASAPSLRLFESATILLYLTSTHDRDHRISFPYATPEYWECMNWLVWQQSGLGPMQGQANHFFRYAPTKIEYAIDRYQTETRRLYGVLEGRLKGEEERGAGLWLVGGKYSIADINCFAWVNWAEWAGVDTKPFPAVERWLAAIQARPAVERGCNIPDKFEMKEAMQTKEGAEEYAKYHSNWVMQGMKEDREKHN